MLIYDKITIFKATTNHYTVKHTNSEYLQSFTEKSFKTFFLKYEMLRNMNDSQIIELVIANSDLFLDYTYNHHLPNMFNPLMNIYDGQNNPNELELIRYIIAISPISLGNNNINNQEEDNIIYCTELVQHGQEQDENIQTLNSVLNTLNTENHEPVRFINGSQLLGFIESDLENL